MALAWKAGLPDDLAAPLQNKLCRVPPDKALRPTAGGHYPLSVDEMAWQLEFFYRRKA